MNTESFISSFLLVIFSVVIIPKNWIHHCDNHTYTYQDHANTTVQKLQLKCSICQYKISVSNSLIEAPKNFISVKNHQTHFLYRSLIPLSTFYFSKGRAPPVC